jgi:hypothetical protein
MAIVTTEESAGANITEMKDEKKFRAVLCRRIQYYHEWRAGNHPHQRRVLRRRLESFGAIWRSTGPTVDYRLDVAYWPHRRLPALAFRLCLCLSPFAFAFAFAFAFDPVTFISHNEPVDFSLLSDIYTEAPRNNVVLI